MDTNEFEKLKRANWQKEATRFLRERKEAMTRKIYNPEIIQLGRGYAVVARGGNDDICRRCGFYKGHAPDCFFDFEPKTVVTNKSVYLSHADGQALGSAFSRTIREEAGIVRATGNDGEQSELGGAENRLTKTRDRLSGV